METELLRLLSVKDKEKVLLFCDTSFLNIFHKWLPSSSQFIDIIEFREGEIDIFTQGMLQNESIKHISYCLSMPLQHEALSAIQRYHSTHLSHLTSKSNDGNKNSKNSSARITLITSIAQDYYDVSSDDLKTPYQRIKDSLSPIEISDIHYFPLHSNVLLSDVSVKNSHLDFFLSNSTHIREIFPAISISYEDIGGAIETQEISPTLLKLCSYELASSIIFNYNCDPSKHVYSLGRTAKNIGKAMQGMFKDLKELHSSMDGTTHRMIKHVYKYAANGGQQLQQQELTPATLLIIDRTEDLFTATSHGSPGENNKEVPPLAHRIMSTICGMRQTDTDVVKSNQDIALPSVAITDQLQTLHLNDDCERRTPITSPFSALAGLPIQLSPSVLAMSHLMVTPEDKTFANLIGKLREAITQEGGQLPSASKKKKALGSEVLGLVQLLITCPGNSEDVSEAEENQLQEEIAALGYNPFLCIKYEGLLSNALAVIEAMQRSSSKQWSAVCNWRYSYDDKTQFEDSLLNRLRQTVSSLGITPHHGSRDKQTMFYEGMMSIFNAIQWIPSNSSPRRAANEEKISKDITFILLQVIRLITLIGNREFRQKEDSITISTVAATLRDYVIYHCPEDELIALIALGILSEEQILNISSCRSELSIAKPTGATFEDDWDPIDEEDEHESDPERDPRLIGLKRDVLNSLHSYIERLIRKLGCNRQVENSHSSQYDPTDLFSSYLEGSKSSVASLQSQNMGVLARSLMSTLKYRDIVHDPLNSLGNPTEIAKNSQEFNVDTIFQHVEGSFAQLTRAGLGLLSKGLGRLGLSGSSNRKPHPGDNSTIIVYVVGGITYKELGQLQSILDSYGDQPIHLIIGSNRIYLADDILYNL